MNTQLKPPPEYSRKSGIKLLGVMNLDRIFKNLVSCSVFWFRVKSILWTFLLFKKLYHHDLLKYTLKVNHRYCFQAFKELAEN